MLYTLYMYYVSNVCIYLYVKYMSKYTQTYIQIHVPENPLPRKYITNSYKPAWHRLSEMYILNLDHFSEFQTQIVISILDFSLKCF